MAQTKPVANNRVVFILAIIILPAATTAAIKLRPAAPLGPDDLKTMVQELGSTASEGRLLAEQADSGHATGNYTRVQAQMLKDNNDQLSTSLEHAQGSDQSVTTKLAAAQVLSRRLADDLSGLNQHPSLSRDDLQQLGQSLQDLEDSL